MRQTQTALSRATRGGCTARGGGVSAPGAAAGRGLCVDAVTPAAHAAREDRAAEAHGELRAAQPGVQRSLLRSSYSERGHRGPDTGLRLGGPRGPCRSPAPRRVPCAAPASPARACSGGGESGRWTVTNAARPVRFPGVTAEARGGHVAREPVCRCA